MCTAKSTVAALWFSETPFTVADMITAEAVVTCDTGMTVFGAGELTAFVALLGMCLTPNRATVIT